MANGTFGVTGEASPLEDPVAKAITDHRFTPQRKLNWRNSKLSFGSVDGLIQSLEQSPTGETLIKAREPMTWAR
jgi:ATP-dependent RNA helicase SUPV3L1/SUV3